METNLRVHLSKFTLVYLDDIIVYSKLYEEHSKHLEIIFELLDKIHLQAKLPFPTTKTELKSFLRMTTYYKKFIKDYSKIADKR